MAATSIVQPWLGVKHLCFKNYWCVCVLQFALRRKHPNDLVRTVPILVLGHVGNQWTAIDPGTNSRCHCIDGTRSQSRRFVHFSVGEVHISLARG